MRIHNIARNAVGNGALGSRMIVLENFTRIATAQIHVTRPKISGRLFTK